MLAEQDLTQNLEALNQITATLNQTENLRGALQLTLERTVSLMGLETGWIFLHDPEAQARWAGRGYVLAAYANLPPALGLDNPDAWDTGCDCQTLCKKGLLKTAYNEVKCSRLATAQQDRQGLVIHASVPLRSGADIRGILNVAAPDWSAFTQQALAVLTNVGHQMGIAIDRSRLFDLLQEHRIHEQMALLDLSRQLLGHLDLEELLNYLVQEARTLLNVDACAILLSSPDENELIFRAASGWRTNPVSNGYRVPTARTGSGKAMRLQQPLVWNNVADPSASESTPMLTWLQEEGFHSAAIVPLIANQRAIGTMVVDTRKAREFKDADLRFLQLMANQAAIAIEKTRLRQQEIAQREMEKEMAVGRQIQLSMLPDKLPQVSGWQFAAVYEAARQVGGDFYDFFYLPGDEGQIGLVIADVSDKGVPAALFMALSRTTIKNTALRGRPPADALTWANRFILEDSQSDMFLTVFYGALDTRTGLLTFANAGHNPPLWWQAATGCFEQLRAPGMVLGVTSEVKLVEQQIRLAPGDALILYTDGVTEAVNEAWDEFGQDRLQTAVAVTLSRSPQATAQEVANAIIGAVKSFTGNCAQYDDVTLLVLRWETDNR